MQADQDHEGSWDLACFIDAEPSPIPYHASAPAGLCCFTSVHKKALPSCRHTSCLHSCKALFNIFATASARGTWVLQAYVFVRFGLLVLLKAYTEFVLLHYAEFVVHVLWLYS